MNAPVATLLSGHPSPPPSAKLEVMSNKRRVFTDGTRTVEVHDIGPSPHASEILFLDPFRRDPVPR